MRSVALPASIAEDVAVLWSYNQLNHDLGPADVAIGLGSHDIGVAIQTARLYQRGSVTDIVFSGASGPSTLGRFPRGEAVHYREHAIGLGVPGDVILVETRATNTTENIQFSRNLLQDMEKDIQSVILVSRPYQQRRAFAICRHHWPEVDVMCSSLPIPFDEYLAHIGDVDRVIHTLVGDTQRVWVYAARGWAEEQGVPRAVRDAYHRLVLAGYTRRLLPE